MHRFIIATAVLLLAPATALGVTTQKAQPPIISLTAAGGVPRCTKLPYSLLSARHKVILRITHKQSASAKAVKHTRLRDVKAGSHTFAWCGKTDLKKPVKPGVYYWRVGATQKAGGTVGWSTFRHLKVTA
jgi:hypothetical protein